MGNELSCCTMNFDSGHPKSGNMYVVGLAYGLVRQRWQGKHLNGSVTIEEQPLKVHAYAFSRAFCALYALSCMAANLNATSSFLTASPCGSIELISRPSGYRAHKPSAMRIGAISNTTKNVWRGIQHIVPIQVQHNIRTWFVYAPLKSPWVLLIVRNRVRPSTSSVLTRRLRSTSRIC